ncbi:hypothetical protein, partial [Latilactobacillus sakei]
KGLSLKISAAETDASYSVQLGRLAITGKQQAAPKKVNQVTIDNRTFDEEGKYAGVNLSWQATTKNKLD